MKSKILLSGLIYTLIGIIMLFQTNVILAIASDQDNPITSAITSAITDIINPSPTPSATPSPTPTPEPTGTPISIPIINPAPIATASPIATSYPTPSASSSAQPVSSPITNPDPFCLNLLLFSLCFDGGVPAIFTPITNPSPIPSPTPQPTSNPTPTPTPASVVLPVINSISPNPANWQTVISISGSNLTNSSQIYINESLIPSDLYKQVSENGELNFTLPAYTDYQPGKSYKLYVMENGVKSNELNLTIAPSVRQDMANPKANQVLVDPEVNLDSSRPEMLLAYSNFNVNLTIPKSVANPTLNYSQLLVSSQTGKQATFNNNLVISKATDLGAIKIEFPTATTIYGPASWDGIINAPRTLATSEANPIASSGKTAQTQTVLEVGLGDIALTFDKAVRLLIPNQAGKLVGFQRGSIFSKITQSCSADTQVVGDALSEGGECYIASGADLVIWTKHFTKFVTYTEIVATTSSASSTSASSNSSASSNPAVCSDTKPASVPKLISAKVTNRNEVTLNWSKAADPVTYYLVAYGTQSGKSEYGNPNIGGKETTSYVVKGLQNSQTYYFKIRAGNNCMPGEFSNEIAVKASGDNIASGNATGFKAGILSVQDQKTPLSDELKFKPITSAKPQRAISEVFSVVYKLISFFSRLFGKS